MHIVEIEGYHLQAELPKTQGNSTGFVNKVESLLIALRTDDGLVGWGETWFAPAPSWAMINSRLARHVLGKDPLDRNQIWQGMSAERGYDRSGLTVMAMSAIDLALWDIAGRAANLPVYRLLGGAVRNEVAAYASGPYFRPGPNPYKDCLSEIEEYLAQGFQAVKMRLGTNPAADHAITQAARQLMGPDRLLAVDMNEGFTPATAIPIADAISDSDIAWVEEPLLPDNLSGYQQLANQFPLPIAAGEALCGSEAFHDLISTKACAIIQPDLALCGGLSEGIQIAGMAKAAGCLVAPHVIGTFVNVHAALQLLAVLPGLPAEPFRMHPIFEYDQTPSPLRNLLGDIPVAKNGTVAVPDAPGLGFDLDPSRLEPFITDSWTLRWS